MLFLERDLVQCGALVKEVRAMVRLPEDDDDSTASCSECLSVTTRGRSTNSLATATQGVVVWYGLLW